MYHRKICDMYKLPEYDVRIMLDMDVRVMKLIVLLDDKDVEGTTDGIDNQCDSRCEIKDSKIESM